MEDQNTGTTATPNTRLAQRIARQLLEQGLIAAGDLTFFVRRLAEGQLREGDWRAVLVAGQIPENDQFIMVQ